MKSNVSRKAFILLPFIVLTLIAALLLLRSTDDSGSVLNINTAYPLSGSTTSFGCEAHDSINYYYYVKTPLSGTKNNKFGLYIYAEVSEYFELAQNLVNSNGGDWGYVLIPYNVKDQDYSKWSDVFSMLRDKHLIPIIQLHDIDTDKYKKQTSEAADFLDSFIWPVRERYISAYNEPNDAKFWGGKLDPKEYATILNYSIDTFKKQNKDFFMLNGGFNSSTSNSQTSMDFERFATEMNKAVDGIFSKLDGWASHSYPQPNFSGSPDDEGRWSIRAYDSELSFLKDNLGVKKELPVFITETGWAHAEGDSYNSSYLPDDKVGEYLKRVYTDYWLKDERVRAVTPFTVWYQEPFDHFSWVNNDKVPYKHYDVIKGMKKISGNPEHIEKGVLKDTSCTK